MFTIRYHTRIHRPERCELSIVGNSPHLGEWMVDAGITGIYNNNLSSWDFEVDEMELQLPPGQELRFKFVINRLSFQSGPDLALMTEVPSAGDVFEYTDSMVGVQGGNYGNFDRRSTFGPVAEEGQVQREFFNPSRMTDQEYDVIIVGSGMGGGTLADHLSDHGVKVLVLEAGGYVFPTHVGNLPRQQAIGRFDKHIWHLWDDFKGQSHEPSDLGSRPPGETIDEQSLQGGLQYEGSQGYALGGRSIYWGGFIPRMSSWELDAWPRTVKWELEDEYYDKAEVVMGRSVGPRTQYNRRVHELLSDLLPEFTHKDAPMAVRKRFEGSNQLDGGVFSTADLLLESYLTPGETGKDNLEILLNHDVIRFESIPDGWRVIARNLLGERSPDGPFRTFQCRRLVLAAGTTETPRLVKNSSLPDPAGLVGKGITDHPTYFCHFSISPDSPFFHPTGDVKIVSQPKLPRSVLEDGSDQAPRDNFNILLEIGAAFNQGRYLDESILKQHLKDRRSLLCEIVFLFNSELLDENQIEYTRLTPGLTIHKVHMAPTALPKESRDRVAQIKNAVLEALGGEELDAGGRMEQDYGGLGGVAHEVGTMRMSVDETATALPDQAPGVVTKDCEYRDQPGLYICDLSIFPTSPAANPSLTLVALALRLGDHLVRDLAD